MREKLAHLLIKFRDLSMTCKGLTIILKSTCLVFFLIRYMKLLAMLCFENEKESDFLSKFKKNMNLMQNRFLKMMEILN